MFAYKFIRTETHKKKNATETTIPESR